MYSNLVCDEMVFKAVVSYVKEDHSSLYGISTPAFFLLVVVTACSILSALYYVGVDNSF